VGKTIVEIRICELEVSGLTILINFSGLNFQISSVFFK